MSNDIVTSMGSVCSSSVDELVEGWSTKKKDKHVYMYSVGGLKTGETTL